MRVLYFSRSYTPHDYRFLAALARTEHRVFHLRLEQGGVAYEDRPIPAEVEQIPWESGKKTFAWGQVPGRVLELRRILRGVQPDVLHAGPVQSCAFLAALAGFPRLATMSWGSDLLVDADRSAWMRLVTRFTLRRTKILLADCTPVRDKAVLFGFPADRVTLFPWGVDLQQFSPGAWEEFRARRGWQNAFVLLSLRTWEPIYGVDVVAKAFVQACRERPDLRLILLGAGSQAGVIREILLRGGVMENVYFGGGVRQADLPAFYRAADIYLSASHSDGSSVSLMEALACGLPALVSDIPGNRDWICEGENGWFFPDSDADALAKGILRAAALHDHLPQMARAARRTAETQANWKVNFEKCLHAYERVIT